MGRRLTSRAGGLGTGAALRPTGSHITRLTTTTRSRVGAGDGSRAA